jgi:hypothetical protein
VLRVKDLSERDAGERVVAWVGAERKQCGEILRLAMLAQDEHASAHAQLEGPQGGRTWFAGHGETVPNRLHYYNILVQYVKNYFKCFEWCGIGGGV